MTPVSRLLVVIGAGGFGREVLDIVAASSDASFELLGVLADPAPDLTQLTPRGVAYLGPVSTLADIDAAYVIGIGAPDVRRRIDDYATSLGREAATLVHPSATRGWSVACQPGTIICSHVSITTNVTIGRHVHLDQNCTVGHDVVLGDYVRANPGATISGSVHVEAGATVGANATIIQGLRVGRDAVIGAGAVVTKDVPAGVTAVGVPARW